MKLKFNEESCCKVLFVGEDDFDNDFLKHLKDRKLFEGKAKTVYIHFVNEDEMTLLAGLGDRELSRDDLRILFYKIAKKCRQYKVDEIQIDMDDLKDYTHAISLIFDGMIQSEYHFDKFKSKKEDDFELTLNLIHVDDKAAKEKFEEVQQLLEGVFLARDLINEPAMYLYPETLAKAAKDKLEPLGVEVEVKGLEEIKKLNMKAFLSVARGSAKEPKLIIMRYKGNPDSDQTIGFVGKGLTYDSGGYSLKPPKGMVTMHGDMGGAGAVIGGMYAIAKNKVKANVTAVVAACENLVSGDAYKTGDIIGSMSGKTIEVINTDAEGRITLADSLYYITTKEDVDCVIDLATLTGACVVALGDIAVGGMTNDEDLLSKVIASGEHMGERIWQLPMYEEYKELIKSDFADIKNSSGRNAGTITAALFLEAFVNDTPWVHLDIAGTSYLDKARGYLPKAATGIGVKTLYNFARSN